MHESGTAKAAAAEPPRRALAPAERNTALTSPVHSSPATELAAAGCAPTLSSAISTSRPESSIFCERSRVSAAFARRPRRIRVPARTTAAHPAGRPPRIHAAEIARNAATNCHGICREDLRTLGVYVASRARESRTGAIETANAKAKRETVTSRPLDCEAGTSARAAHDPNRRPATPA